MILTRTSDFLKRLLPATNNFPRAHRHTFTRRLLDAAFDMRKTMRALILDSFSPWRVSKNTKKAVTPAKAGVPKLLKTLDSRFHGNDGKWMQRLFIDSLLVREGRC